MPALGTEETSEVKGGDNSVVLGAAAGNALAHLMLIAMENRGETRHKAALSPLRIGGGF